MQTVKKILNAIIAIIMILMQQLLIVGLGIVVYSQSGPVYGIAVLFLCIPMLYCNYWTWRYMMKYGFILFATANADTSQLDVKAEDNPYLK